LVHTRHFLGVRIEETLWETDAGFKRSDSNEDVEEYFVGETARYEAQPGFPLGLDRCISTVRVSWVIRVIAELPGVVLDSRWPRTRDEGA